MSAPNGFAGMWNPICPYCGGYMHTGHTSECPVTRSRAPNPWVALFAIRLLLSPRKTREEWYRVGYRFPWQKDVAPSGKERQ